MMLLKGKCFVCGTAPREEAGIKKEVFVYGYTRPLKKFFCSAAHLRGYEDTVRKIQKAHVPACRTCFG